MRKYRSGMRWAFWRWTDTRTGYLDRLHVVKTPRFAVCVHWIRHADPDPYLHDHPVSFLSLILRGGYIEQRTDGLHVRKWFNFVRATDRHRIRWASHRTVTLCFMGPKVQEWGFYVNGWKVQWQSYYLMPKGRA